MNEITVQINQHASRLVSAMAITMFLSSMTMLLLLVSRWEMHYWSLNTAFHDAAIKAVLLVCIGCLMITGAGAVIAFRSIDSLASASMQRVVGHFNFAFGTVTSSTILLAMGAHDLRLTGAPLTSVGIPFWCLAVVAILLHVVALIVLAQKRKRADGENGFHA